MRTLSETRPSNFFVSSWISSLRRLQSSSGRCLDVAGGSGRHARPLAAHGLDVTLSDVSPVGVEIAARETAEAGLELATLVYDVEEAGLPPGPWDVIVQVHFLHRPLFNDIREGLKPGGAVVYQTFTTAQLELESGPKNADHLLAPRELAQVFSDWEILRYREYVENEGPGNPSRALAGIIAKKPE